MKHILKYLSSAQPEKEVPVLATIIKTSGSTPQVPGASAVFSRQGLVAGTLGGGIMEGDATRKASDASKHNRAFVYEFGLDADIEAEEGAICGGTASVLLEVCSGSTLEAVRAAGASLKARTGGVLATVISRMKSGPASVRRTWLVLGSVEENELQPELEPFKAQIEESFETGSVRLIREEGHDLFLQPLIPLPRLLIAGAGHIGRALAHLGSLLDFEVTVIDDRKEFCNRDNIPDADHHIVRAIGPALGEDPKSGDSYIVIVTRGHRDDGEALRHCIASDAAYIGMIGSRTKTALMRRQFLEKGWATREQLERLHAPIGLDIGSKTVREIAVSIAAELIRARSRGSADKEHLPGRTAAGMSEPSVHRSDVRALVLAAGASGRMGRPKQLLPFGNSTMLGTVIENIRNSSVSGSVVVLGANYGELAENIKHYPVTVGRNMDYRKGMLTSVQRGLEQLPGGTAKVMILLGDQPMIGPGIIDSLIDAAKHSDKEIAVAAYRGKRGHPLMFGKKYIPEIMGMAPEQSMKDFLSAHAADILEVKMEHPEILRDIDTMNDYHKEINYGR